MNLAEYVAAHTVRGECNCGKCCDRGENSDPTGHVVDVGFFKVAATNSPTSEELIRLVSSHKGGFWQVNPFDGAPHDFIELGGWIGSQALAMQFMALAALLDLSAVLTTASGPVLLPKGLASLSVKVRLR